MLWTPVALVFVAWASGAQGFAARAGAGGGQQRSFFATCSQGLSGALEAELSAEPINAVKIVPGKRGVEFWGSEETGYQALLWSRVANGVWELLARRDRVDDRQDLYTVVRRVPGGWDSLLGVDGTLAVQCIVGEGVARDLTHTHFSSLTVKNAIVDHFRDNDPNGRRPSVDTESPTLPLILYLHRGEASLYRSLSGLTSMHKRGYRDAMHVAALRETLAAAMLINAGYDPEQHVLCDPMAGSGTIAIEAALMARRVAPGLLRLRKAKAAAALAPASWLDTDVNLLRRVILDARNAMIDSAPQPILVNDVHRGACSLAIKDAESAGVIDDIRWSNRDVLDYIPPVRPDLVVTNPPWDLRLTEGAEESWDRLGKWLKREAGGAQAWTLSGNAELTRALFMKARRKINIEQGGVKLRLLNYDVLKPKPRPQTDEEEEEEELAME